MKIFLLFVTVCLPLFSLGQKNKDANVLSYYAVTNSIDGQPLINKRNLLRFYPVFALRDSTYSVTITIYYGNQIFIKPATPLQDGLYWEVKLPDFDLGDAIQRYEVETGIRYNIDVKKEIESYKKSIVERDSKIAKQNNSLLASLKSFDSLFKKFSNEFDESTRRIALLNIAASYIDDFQMDRSVQQQFDLYLSMSKKIYSKIDSISKRKVNLKSDTALARSQKQLSELGKLIKMQVDQYGELKEPLKEVVDWVNYTSKIQDQYLSVGYQFRDKVLNHIENQKTTIFFSNKNQEDLAKYITSKEYLIDSLKRNLIKALSDKAFSGSGIQKSDILFDNNYKNARILYRNYRSVNRTLVALDPAERLSIFRIRYIPFPVVGNNLEGPYKQDVPIVFEAGVTFGNQVITSNDSYKPSIERLGVAFAFTPQLFSKDAKILALLFSYDFNAYASIGVGANFGTLSANSPDPYFSFGINNRAFQRLVTGIGKLFK
ncbi:MAG: hypothetical protein JSS79_13820 [Bacteroidetes bacterium]|nr:hypothetical protein [Bacteroidota bacterium]